MPRRAAYSSHPLARVRAWFGLQQAELALYLGISAPLVHALESGQRPLSLAVQVALLPLQLQLPAPGPAAEEAAVAPLPSPLPPTPPPLPPGTPAPDAAALAFRQRQCRHQAAGLLAQADALARQAQVAQRWAAALPALRAALPPDPGPQAEPDPAHDWPAWQAWYRHRWLAQRPTTLPPAASARYHLLRLRAEALEAEAGALAALLGP
ncbi:helix-turn-helix transcriptional regulator [Hymenobacter sp. ASUV-10]|uniref:Helix-turn-helix transcriptional regulator n=1 Tax=Hymenobacter aranciens TaxID=3063996 RepID=A0ABT9BBY2_9BACT|nr:helix-turn-helix transcriptional regulator [Hymenobacter sp. ASUV-10]MDO7875290.1 helix-turn-helix transcriptional regulator [Hymenobacter sp. ASUV-10]